QYYVISADNSAAAAIAFLTRWAAANAAAPGGSTKTGIAAACDWCVGLSAACAGQSPSTKLSDKGWTVCTTLAKLPDVAENARKTRSVTKQARSRWKAASKLAKSKKQGLSGACQSEVVTALKARGATPK